MLSTVCERPVLGPRRIIQSVGVSVAECQCGECVEASVGESFRVSVSGWGVAGSEHQLQNIDAWSVKVSIRTSVGKSFRVLVWGVAGSKR